MIKQFRIRGWFVLLIVLLTMSTVLSAQDDDFVPIEEEERLLAWVAPTRVPGQQLATQPGELVVFTAGGSRQRVATLPEGTRRVVPCGLSALSPDGSAFAVLSTTFSGGAEQGDLSIFRRGTNALDEVASGLNPMSCVGSSQFQWSADGTRYGYVNYALDAGQRRPGVGQLVIRNAADDSVLETFDSVSQFHLTDEGAVFTGFFFNERGEATEGGIFTYAGSGRAREVATLRANENCSYQSATVNPVTAERFIVVMGVKCVTADTEWQLYTVEPTTRSVQLQDRDNFIGSYFSFSATNTILPAADASAFFFTIPDGLTNRTVAIAEIDTASFEREVIVENYAIMPNVSQLPYEPVNAVGRLSRDGNFFAAARNTPNNEASVVVIDLANPQLPPIEISAGSRGDVVTDFIFSNDSANLYFIAGGTQGGDNSLFQLDLITGTDIRVARGQFDDGVISPDDTRIALLQWETFEDEPPYTTLLVTDIATGEEAVIFEGADIDEDGELINQQFAYPLVWMSTE